VKLRQRMLLVFAVTVIAGMGVLYFISRDLLLSSFQQLENEQMKQDVQNALDGVDQQERRLGTAANGQPSEFYYRIIHANGELRWLWERTFPILDAQGRQKQITGFTEDITEFNRNEKALVSAQLDLEKRLALHTAELGERKDGDCVEISISDTGTGIPEEARKNIFEPFFTTKGVGKGTGQGLALARAVIVEKHGGTLTYATEMGKGTTFYVRLPLHGAAVREEALVQ
jgi:hypothetical protein